MVLQYKYTRIKYQPLDSNKGRHWECHFKTIYFETSIKHGTFSILLVTMIIRYVTREQQNQNKERKKSWLLWEEPSVYYFSHKQAPL